MQVHFVRSLLDLGNWAYRKSHCKPRREKQVVASHRQGYKMASAMPADVVLSGVKRFRTVKISIYVWSGPHTTECRFWRIFWQGSLLLYYILTFRFVLSYDDLLGRGQTHR